MAAPEGTTAVGQQSASQIWEQTLQNTLGMSGLGDWAAALSNNFGASTDDMLYYLRYGSDPLAGADQPSNLQALARTAATAYDSTFPGMKEMLKKGTWSGASAPPEQAYLSWKAQVKEAVGRYVTDADVAARITDPQKMAQMMLGDVSPSEVSSRLNLAATAAATTTPEFRNAMSSYYGVSTSDLTAFYLDQDATEEVLKQRTTTAAIGAERLAAIGGLASENFATRLAQQGYTAEQARSGFQSAARLSALARGFTDVVDQQTLEAAQFADTQAEQDVQQATAARKATFAASSQVAGSQAGLTGLGTAST